MKNSMIKIAFGSAALMLASCAHIDLASNPFASDVTETSDAKLLLDASHDCDLSADPKFASLVGKYPLSVYQKSARPSLAQLTDSNTPSQDQKDAMISFSTETKKCNAQINYVVEKYFSPRFVKAWGNYNFQQTQIDQMLFKDQINFGQANGKRYAAAVALSNELLEYRFTYKGEPNVAGKNFKTLETCKRNYGSNDINGLLTLLLNDQSRLVTGDVICPEGTSQALTAESDPTVIQLDANY